MQKHPTKHPIDQEILPPFGGFPREGLTLLRKLKKNNNRPWFLRHKQDYEEFVRFPMQCLVAELGRRMADEAPEFEFNPKRSIFRVYRDVRFSKNKAPYKTNIAAGFSLKRGRGETESPGLYVGVEPGEIFIGGGIYMPGGDQLKAIRHAIAERPEEFLAIVKSPTFKKEFRGIMGEKLQRAPLGYPKDHPMIAYLTFKQFFIGKEYVDKLCLSPKLADVTERVFTNALPFIRWIAEASV